jgi:8-oxo-dGTP pyrophosphatase MutT (NUDIX family)
MDELTVNWKTASTILNDDVKLPVRQVYVWIITKDKHVVLVSKDGKKWQFPGGKPDAGETLLQTAVREVQEETGLDISDVTDSLQFFGYYVIHEPGQAIVDYLQTRFFVELGKNADELDLHVGSEDEAQVAEDVIKFVEAPDIQTALSYIPWLADSPEYKLHSESYRI